MTKEQKLVALTAFLPVLADFIEDLNDQSIFKRALKNKANMLIDEIRKTDELILRIDESNREQIFNEQIDLQLAFRQWIESNIKF
jgi:nucleoside-triphosphatase THEP1